MRSEYQRVIIERCAIASWFIPLLAVIPLSLLNAEPHFFEYVPPDIAARQSAHSTAMILLMFGGIPFGLWSLIGGRRLLSKRLRHHALGGLIVGGLMIMLFLLGLFFCAPVDNQIRAVW
jgi:hypothetical protein